MSNLETSQLPATKTALTKPVKIVSFNDLSDKYGITFQRSHLYDLEKEGSFPKRVKLGMNRIGWVQSEIEDWLAERLAARND